MRHRTCLIPLTMLLVALGAVRASGGPAPPPAEAPTAPPDSAWGWMEVAPPDTVFVLGRHAGITGRRTELLYDALQPVETRFLAPGSTRDWLLGPPRIVELNRWQCGVYGADMGGNAGLWLGGIGNIMGLWDEKTALYMMGAGAALGAIWGSTSGADDSGFRIRVLPDR